jgi:hypothetical protein
MRQKQVAYVVDKTASGRSVYGGRDFNSTSNTAPYNGVLWIGRECEGDKPRLEGPEPPTQRSGAGVRLLVGPAQPIGGDVGVELGGGQRGVPQQFLHAAQVRAALEEMRSGGVS